MRSDEVAVVVGRGAEVMTMGEVSSYCFRAMLPEFSSWRKSVVTCSVISGNLYYFGIESKLPIAGCATSGGEGVWRVSFVEK